MDAGKKPLPSLWGDPQPARPEGVEHARRLKSRESAGVPLEYCPNCSSKLTGRQCKLACLRCGYFLSCSDYY